MPIVAHVNPPPERLKPGLWVQVNNYRGIIVAVHRKPPSKLPIIECVLDLRRFWAMPKQIVQAHIPEELRGNYNQYLGTRMERKSLTAEQRRKRLCGLRIPDAHPRFSIRVMPEELALINYPPMRVVEAWKEFNLFEAPSGRVRVARLPRKYLPGFGPCVPPPQRKVPQVLPGQLELWTPQQAA